MQRYLVQIRLCVPAHGFQDLHSALQWCVFGLFGAAWFTAKHDAAQRSSPASANPGQCFMILACIPQLEEEQPYWPFGTAGARHACMSLTRLASLPRGTLQLSGCASLLWG